ncbi:MAG: thioesterase family protein [Ilumatobacteraceae bacterium]
MTDVFFTSERRPDGSEWFSPTDHARGPWDADACHGGPPTGLLVRALEQTMPDIRLARISVDLGRPVPMAGFTIEAEVVRAGRATGNSRAAIVDADGKVRATATGMHVAVSPTPLFPGTLDNSGLATPRLAEAVPGEFPIGRVGHDRPGFGHAVEMRYPPGEDNGPGATAAWMRTIPLLPDEEPSAFQRISPLSDCGNAFGRHANPDQVQFVNTDLVIALHRDPVGEWMGSRSVAYWQPTGVGLADALLFDDGGPVGRALQTLLLRPVG